MYWFFLLKLNFQYNNYYLIIVNGIMIIGDGMNKKFLIIFVVLFVGMAIIFYNFKTKVTNEYDINSNLDSNSSNKEQKLIGNINDISLYVTDYKYYVVKKGYNYTKVELSNEQISSLKDKLSKVDFNQEVSDVVYGKYKLIIDDKTIFFDPDTDSALYLEGNKVFKLSNDIKKIVVNSNDTCSCCKTSKCKINLCACNPS